MPNLIIIAGCNGAGKSTFASTFIQDGLTSFDYDRLYLVIYNSLPDSELRDEFAKNQAAKEFEDAVENALQNRLDFCYETNFDSHPLYWAQKFRENGYQINLIFFCLSNQELAKHRVWVRTEFKGHFVDNKTIDIKWKAGYKNLNLHYRFFDNILFVDNSKQNDIYSNLLQIEGGSVIQFTDELPEYFSHRLPGIYSLVKNNV